MNRKILLLLCLIPQLSYSGGVFNGLKWYVTPYDDHFGGYEVEEIAHLLNCFNRQQIREKERRIEKRAQEFFKEAEKKYRESQTNTYGLVQVLAMLRSISSLIE